jgi:IS5 family transposase
MPRKCHAKTILKIARALGPEVIEQLHRQVVEVAKRAGVTHGRRFRIDTTLVETNVHDPTDSSLLQDGVRVLTRTMQRAAAALGGVMAVRDRLRSIARRCLAKAFADGPNVNRDPSPSGWHHCATAFTLRRIRRQSRTPATRPELISSYRRLMATTRAVVRDASTMIRRIGHRLGTVAPATGRTLHRAQRRLQEMRPLVQRILTQTRARLLGGDTHVPDKSHERLWAAHRRHPQRQDRHAYRIRQARDDSSTLALVLELVEGPTLADRIAQGSRH